MVKNSYVFAGNDLLNKENKRNIKNVNKREYNCGGYALETFNWYCPYNAEDDRELNLFDNGWDEDEKVRNFYLEHTVKRMLEEFDDLRLIDNIKELKENEFAIAYKVGDNDFHYMKRAKSGVWYHKMGSSSRIQRATGRYVFGETWSYGRYQSKTVLFAKKNKTK